MPKKNLKIFMNIFFIFLLCITTTNVYAQNSLSSNTSSLPSNNKKLSQSQEDENAIEITQDDVDNNDLNVDFPAELNISVDENGNTSVDNQEIINNSSDAIKINNISFEIVEKNKWTLVPFSCNFNSFKLNSNKIGFNIKNYNMVDKNGKFEPKNEEWSIIQPAESLSIPVEFKISVQKHKIETTQLANIIYNFEIVPDKTIPDVEENPEKLKSDTNNDTSVNLDTDTDATLSYPQNSSINSKIN